MNEAATNFNLDPEYERVRRERRSQLYTIAGVSAVVAVVALIALVSGVRNSNLGFSAIGIFLAGVVCVGVYAFFSIGTEARSISINDESIEVRMNRGKDRKLTWSNPRFGIGLMQVHSVRSAARSADPRFRLVTGRMFNIGLGPSWGIYISKECYDFLLANSRTRGYKETTTTQSNQVSRYDTIVFSPS